MISNFIYAVYKHIHHENDSQYKISVTEPYSRVSL